MRRQCAGVLFFLAMLASSPASAQFMCTPPTSNPLTCTQRAHAFYQNRDRDKPERHNDQFRNGQRVCVGDHTGGGVAAATNSGSNIANGILAQTGAGGARVSF